MTTSLTKPGTDPSSGSLAIHQIDLPTRIGLVAWALMPAAVAIGVVQRRDVI